MPSIVPGKYLPSRLRLPSVTTVTARLEGEGSADKQRARGRRLREEEDVPRKGPWIQKACVP